MIHEMGQIIIIIQHLTRTNERARVFTSTAMPFDLHCTAQKDVK